MKTKLKDALWQLGLVGLTVAVAVYMFLVQTNPILLMNEDPKARMFVDEDPVAFDDGATGTMLLFPWKLSYVVLVRSTGGDEQRRIYPWATGSDSGSVSVSKKGIAFDMESSPV